jgi:hypothetical protein
MLRCSDAGCESPTDPLAGERFDISESIARNDDVLIRCSAPTPRESRSADPHCTSDAIPVNDPSIKPTQHQSRRAAC